MSLNVAQHPLPEPVICVHCGEWQGTYQADGTFALYTHNRKIMFHPDGSITMLCRRCKYVTDVITRKKSETLS